MPFGGAEFRQWRIWVCHGASLGLHIALLVFGGILITVAAEFGIEVGESGLADRKSRRTLR